MIEGARASANTSYGMLAYSDIEMWMKHEHVLEQSEIFYLEKFRHDFMIFSDIGNTGTKNVFPKLKWEF